MTEKVIKIIGGVATAVGVVATLVSGWASDKKMEATIEEKVNKALEQKTIEE